MFFIHAEIMYLLGTVPSLGQTQLVLFTEARAVQAECLLGQRKSVFGVLQFTVRSSPIYLLVLSREWMGKVGMGL